MISRNLLSIMLAVLVLLGGAFGLYQVWVTDSGQVYFEGCEVFSTEQDYTAFKLAFTDPGIRLLDASILSSEPPIVVSFKAVSSDFDYEFPYGGRSISDWLTHGGGGLILFSLLVLAALALAFLPLAFLNSHFRD